MPSTQHRSLRVPDEEWDAAMSKALDEYRSLTSVIREFLRDYVKEEGQ